MQLAIEKAGKILSAEFDIKLEAVHSDVRKTMERMDEAAERSLQTITSKLDKIGVDTHKILVNQATQDAIVEAHGLSIRDLYRSRLAIGLVLLAGIITLVISLLNPSSAQTLPAATQISQPQSHVDGG